MLATATGSPSHARALLPFARALGAAGHDVVVACPPTSVAVFDGAPVRVEPVMPPMAALSDTSTAPPAELGRDELLAAVFAGPHVTDTVHSLQALGPTDLVLRDGTETAGLLLAEHRGVPHLPVPSGGANILPPALLAEQLRRRRRELGFAEGDDPAPLYRHGRLDCMPAEFSLARPDMPTALAYRQDDEVVREALPGWIAELPTDRPLVLASIGTALPMMAGGGRGVPADPVAGLRRVLDAVALLDAEVVVATGGVDAGVAPAPHVHPVDWVPQPLLLQCADVFLCHGGYNGVREAVRAGVPMAVAPQFGDQQHAADRIEALGLGRACGDRPEDLAAVVTALIDDRAVRTRVRRAQRAMLALPPVDAAVADLEATVAGSVGAA